MDSGIANTGYQYSDKKNLMLPFGLIWNLRTSLCCSSLMSSCTAIQTDGNTGTVIGVIVALVVVIIIVIIMGVVIRVLVAKNRHYQLSLQQQAMWVCKFYLSIPSPLLAFMVKLILNVISQNEFLISTVRILEKVGMACQNVCKQDIGMMNMKGKYT